jgi:hypothetical protein
MYIKSHRTHDLAELIKAHKCDWQARPARLAGRHFQPE